MQFGLFSNGHRHGRSASRAYEEDLFEIVTADRLGFHEAWLSEHIGLKAHQAKLSGDADKMR